jgi:hypothetical protein
VTIRKWTDDDLREAILTSITFKDVMIALGLKPGGGNESKVRAVIKELELDTSHFRRGGYIQNPEALFTKNKPYHTSLRKHYLKLVPYECRECGISEWNGKPLTLQLDHIDGDRTNNTLDNLRLLCPNCHSQTETWAIQKKFMMLAE